MKKASLILVFKLLAVNRLCPYVLFNITTKSLHCTAEDFPIGGVLIRISLFKAECHRFYCKFYSLTPAGRVKSLLNWRCLKVQTSKINPTYWKTNISNLICFSTTYILCLVVDPTLWGCRAEGRNLKPIKQPRLTFLSPSAQ